MNFLNKLKKEKETDAEKVKPIHSERKFSFQDALGNLRSAVFGKAVNIKELYKKKADQNMQSDEMLDLSSKLRLHKNKVRIRTAVILTIVLVASVGYGVYHHVKVYRHYTLVSGEERSDDNATQYVFLKKGCILKCNPNGVTCVNKSNEVQWNTTFTMQNPILDICGTTVAVADQRGNEVYIFNENGLVGNFKVEYTLTKIRVAKQGVVAAVLEDGDVTWINVYDSQGNIIVKNKTSIGQAGYPLDMDISSDGLKMAVSFADGGVVKNIDPLLMAQPVSSKTSSLIREYLEAVVTDGTATSAAIPGYRIGGKTGTAEKLPRGDGRYIISFICAVPIDDPQVVVYTVIDEPNIENQEDGSYTKDLARNILTEILPYLGIYPTEEITEEERQSLGMQVEKEGGDTQWVSQYVYDDYGNLMYDETTWEPLTEMVEVDENGNVVSSESEDTNENGSLYGNVAPPDPQGEEQIDENWSDGVTSQDLQIGTQ